MGLYKELCVVFMVTILFSILLLYESKEVDDYAFPAYSTELCPRNQTEWNERSSAINCNSSNGYMCLPNEKLTELIEFCHAQSLAWVQEGVCLYLIKKSSEVSGYNCVHFISGCPNSSHISSNSYIYQSCFAIGNGCFIAEPSCNGTKTATPSPVETTDYKRTESGINSTQLDNTKIYDKKDVSISFGYNTTEYAEESTVYKDSINNNSNSWVTQVAISLGLFVPMCVSCILVIIYYKKGHGSCKRSSDDDAHASGELKPFLEKNEQYKLDPKRKESQRDQFVYEDWEHIDSKFIQTKACKRVESLIQKENLVIVVGHSGSGKSATIQHIALKYRREGWVVKKANEVKDAIDAFISNNVLENQTLFVLHDPIGKESFDEQAYKSWKKLEEDLKACSKKCKLLLSCRKCVQSDERAMGLFKTKSIIVDIDAEDGKLSNDEKLKIWNIYKSGNTSIEIDLTEIIKIDAYFPLLCKLFFSDEENQKKGLRFFKEPVKVYKEEIEYYKTSSKDKFCALVLLVLFNNELCVSDLHNEGNSEQMYKLALKLCGMEDCTAPSTIRCALETLNGSYVTKIGDIYQFRHDFVMEVTSHVFGTEYPRAMIEYADIGFLRQKVKLDGCNGQNDLNSIYISNRHLDSLADRLLKEIVGKRLFDVALNPCLKVKKVVDAMIKNIEMHQDKIKLLLVKTDISLEIQNFSQKSNHWCFTKLDFLSLNCYVSPVCALIVFSHADLYNYCLKTVQQLSINFKDTSVFFAVCCSGAIDLFNMFSEDEILKFLKEKWGYLYPIHIVSVFHNYELLQKLIELEVDINQRNMYGETALILALKNISNVSEDSNEYSRHYQTLQLLLLNGADSNLCTKRGLSPLYVACRNEHISTLQLLLRNGAEINLCSKMKISPLSLACYNGAFSTVKFLLDHGADINATGVPNRFNPFQFAWERQHFDILQLLEETYRKQLEISPGNTE